MAKASQQEIRQWKENLQKQQESGLSVAQWSRQNNIPSYAFHYWKRKLSHLPLSRASFSEIKTSQQNKITIEFRGFFIHVNEGFEEQILKRCLVLLRHFSCLAFPVSLDFFFVTTQFL